MQKLKSSKLQAGPNLLNLPALFVLSADGPVATGLDGADGSLAFDDVAAGKSITVQMDFNIVQLK